MELLEWTDALARELDVDVAVDVRGLLDVARVAAHSVDRPAAPLTTFLIGWAAARGDGSAEEMKGLLARASALAEQWPARAAAQPSEGPGTPAG